MLKDNIKIYRLSRKMTQQEIANVLNITRQAVTRWENGDVEPSTENLISLSKIFNCTVDELIHGIKVNTTNKIKPSNQKVFWNIRKENIFVITLSSIIFLFYLIQMSFWSYSMTLFFVIETPIFILSTIFTASIDEDVKSRDGFISLIRPLLIILAIHILFGLITEL